jgi:hypothetical protein
MRELVVGVQLKHGIDQPERTAFDLMSLSGGIVDAAVRTGAISTICRRGCAGRLQATSASPAKLFAQFRTEYRCAGFLELF